jgi:ribosomal protein S18 acetylase RimI-like enzyme
MWIHPSFRRMGLGRQLLDAAIDWARAQKADYVDLGVTCGDSAARRLYERAGFVPIGAPEPLRPGSQTMAQPMRLRLGSAPTFPLTR